MTGLRLLRIAGLGAALVALPSCHPSTQPVMSVDRVIYKNHGQLGLEEIRDRIVAGLDDKGWGVVDEDAGWMIAEVRDDDEWARVRITYDASHYAIIHFETHPDFRYDGSTIHRRYNSWVEDLDEAINDQFIDDDDDDDDDEEEDESLDQIAAEPAAATVVAAPSPVLAEPSPSPAPASEPAPAAAAPAAAPPEAPPG